MRYRNTTYALIDGLQDALSAGERMTVHGSSVAELRNRVMTIERPRERCIITPRRHNDIVATVAETMWVLGGRDDLAYLVHYLPRAAQFSDDGRTWRAAYGPRIRNWQGVDQLKETFRLLRTEPSSRRAVMSLFDPAADFSESRDIPCNNWFHWLVRDGRLHLNVAIRSNDMVWGFSGINAFEWSVLHELMAVWLGVPMGDLTFFVSSFHLYSRHERRAGAIVESFPGTTCYEWGLAAPSFCTPWGDFDGLVREWFALESHARTRPESLDAALATFPDPLLGQFLTVIQLANGARCGWPLMEIDERLARMPETDLTAAAYEYFHRRQPLSHDDIPHLAIARYWAQYTAPSPAERSFDADTFRRALTRLHAEKTASYGNAWKRRGEQISILANIARKVDRIERVADGAPATADESLVDTAVDLFVYCMKYQTFLADADPEVAAELFQRAGLRVRSPYSDSLEAFDYLVAVADLGALEAGRDTAHVRAEDILRHFADLEACFAADGAQCPPKRRLERAQRLAEASVELIAALKRASPDLYRRFLVSCFGGSI